MTEDYFPITPPPELVEQWFLSARAMPVDQWVTDVATQAARWGSDQELEACCEWLKGTAHIGIDLELLHARRPKPPSLKEEALDQLKSLEVAFLITHGGNAKTETIRRALESLPD